ncbi:MAG: RDD family protein [Candidatus Electrothrix aestuarii]|uniref:RDD family protein n=1 Tax=Candidatus Electrothrix aestuarii TaxID=3062594 RepID=A0AAU8LTS2_9BACT|nr:RDD family protein [Candidatus Electrothrix aestuarii]
MEKVNPNKRVCACLFDILFITLILIVLKETFRWGDYNKYINLSLFILFSLRDSFKGKSLGKLIVGLRVLDLNGKPIFVFESFKRNSILLWPEVIIYFLIPNHIKFIYFAYLIIFITVIIEYVLSVYSKTGRRFGDIIAETKMKEKYPDKPGWTYYFSFILCLLVLIIMLYAFGIKGIGISFF